MVIGNRHILLVLILFVGALSAQAQIGYRQLAQPQIGVRPSTVRDIARSTLPKCVRPLACVPGACAVFTFIGEGSWSERSNWEFGLVPPTLIIGCYEVHIRPLANKRAVMVVSEAILNGGKLIVDAGSQLLVPGNIIIQQ